MKAFMERRQLQLQEINRRVRTDAPRFMEEEDARYAGEVGRLARHLAAGLNGRRIVMLCGPTSSGKTTTALLLRDSLREMAVDAHTVSLDDFYRGRELAPVLEDGSFDYEALEALDSPGSRPACRRSLKTVPPACRCSILWRDVPRPRPVPCASGRNRS